MAPEILLIDDDPLVRTVIAENLADGGFTVHVASGERQAIERLGQHPQIKVALVDYCLPQPTGISLCLSIMSRSPEVRVALFTGHGQLAEIRRGDSDIPVLPKLIRHEELVGAVEALLEGREIELDDLSSESRAEALWRRQQTHETVKAVGRALHSVYDGSVTAPVPDQLRDKLQRIPDRH